MLTWEGKIVYFDGDEETVLEPEREIGFCSDACAWRIEQVVASPGIKI